MGRPRQLEMQLVGGCGYILDLAVEVKRAHIHLVAAYAKEALDIG